MRTAPRHLARGSPCVDEFVDHWPGAKATRRPAIAFPGSEPRAEPIEPQKKFAPPKSDVPARARNVPPPEPTWPTVSAERKLLRPRIRYVHLVSSARI